MNNNVFIAFVLSIAILFGYQNFYVKPRMQALHAQQVEQGLVPIAPQNAVKDAPNATGLSLRSRTQILKETSRVEIDTPELSGSINLKGARFDDLVLKKYKEDTSHKSSPITLLSPSGSDSPFNAYYADFNWLADSVSINVPNSDTVWKAESKKLTPDRSVRLTWNNGQGLFFERSISVDADAMFTIVDRVSNKAGNPTTLYPFGVVARRGVPATKGSSVVHEGPLGVFQNTLEEIKYKKVMDEQKIVHESDGGWLGITDKYWLIAMIPPQSDKIIGEFVYNRAGAKAPDDGVYQTNFRSGGRTILAGESIERTTQFFAGAKRVKLLDRYAEQYKIPHFDRAIDFGIYYFLTRPFLYLLSALDHAVGNMGLAILIFTVLLKLATLPLSLKSYHSMARMKALQPEMKRIQERYGQDRVRQSQEVMELYKREGVNPMSGCFPMLVQIPIFFALYKVLYVNIEMRGAPFYGWISDMSVPDPTSWFNFFGLAPWGVLTQHSLDLFFFTAYFPPALHVGAWPLLMGISMFLQQKMSPQPPDRSQARMMSFMPILMTYVLSGMPSGLVIYWTWSNLIGILQQWYIMRKNLGQKKPA